MNDDDIVVVMAQESVLLKENWRAQLFVGWMRDRWGSFSTDLRRALVANIATHAAVATLWPEWLKAAAWCWERMPPEDRAHVENLVKQIVGVPVGNLIPIN